ncbi:unnamed protein product [Caenorhabditis brenneri]
MLDKKNFKYGVLSDDDDFLIDYDVKNLDEVKARNAVIRKMKNEYKKNIDKCATLKNIVGDLKVKEDKAKEELNEAETAFKSVFVSMISTFGRRILMMSDSSECSSNDHTMAKRVRLEDKGSSTPIPDSKMNNGSAVPNLTPTASPVKNNASESAVLLKKERKRK